jgi:hypothetical protein
VLAPLWGTFGYDAFSYWAVDLNHLYAGHIGDLGWFPYSPALAQLASFFDVVPWTTFIFLWEALLVASVLWLGGRRFLWLLAFPPVAYELYYANINLLIAAAIALGMRYPAAWSFVFVSKVTPGVALLWFVARGEWRHVFIALAATLAVAGASFAIAPHLWWEWLDAIQASSAAGPALSINPPLLLRLPLAAALVVWGARTHRTWTVPVAAAFAMPVLWLAVFSVLAAIPAVRRLAAPTARTSADGAAAESRTASRRSPDVDRARPAIPDRPGVSSRPG